MRSCTCWACSITTTSPSPTPAYRGLPDPGVPHAFYEFNTGVLAWRASDRVAAFLRSWEETYLAWLSEEPFPGASKASNSRRADAAFRRCAWEHEMRLFVLAPEYNFRLGYPTTVVDRVHVIHGNHEDYDALAARVNDRQQPRTWPPPLPLREKVARTSAQGCTRQSRRTAAKAP